MSQDYTFPWTRREWLHTNAVGVTTAAFAIAPLSRRPFVDDRTRARHASQSALADAAVLESLVKRAVEAGHAAGATYVDARVTRTIYHYYPFGGFGIDSETVGFGVRALVDGAWGFASSAVWTLEEAARLAHDAVYQAKESAGATPWTVELSHCPVATGHWQTPVRVDAFTVPIEEKLDFMRYWAADAARQSVPIDAIRSMLQFARQERVLATSEGTLISQTCHESGGSIACGSMNEEVRVSVRNVGLAGMGWERFLDADITGQFPTLRAELAEKRSVAGTIRPITIGRYTLVCDGTTMASMVAATLGVATQLDRALGYESNAGGSSYLDDPLNMVGTTQVAAPAVTITADRSAPGQLATVKWDDEGVAPESVTLVKNGMVNDFQTTREQAPWLAPYYQRRGTPVRSHGFASAESALVATLQQMPNLTMVPSSSSADLTAMISTVTSGVLVTDGFADADLQARNGVLTGSIRRITNGRLGQALQGGQVVFSTLDFWKNLSVIGDSGTMAHTVNSQYSPAAALSLTSASLMNKDRMKGQPGQQASYTVTAPAAIVGKQAIVDPSKRG